MSVPCPVEREGLYLEEEEEVYIERVNCVMSTSYTFTEYVYFCSLVSV